MALVSLRRDVRRDLWGARLLLSIPFARSKVLASRGER
jgi:hypothetical protein